jgi:hypothetical protein
VEKKARMDVRAMREVGFVNEEELYHVVFIHCLSLGPLMKEVTDGETPFWYLAGILSFGPVNSCGK